MALPDVIPVLAPARHMPMRVRVAGVIGDDELFEICALNRELRIERTKEGELIIMSPTGAETGRRNFALIGQLYAWIARDGRGVGFDSSTGFLLPNGAERSPDVAWVRRERWDALSPEAKRKFAPLCPDFVVDLRSPSEDLADLEAKMQEYVECGANLGWLIDADAKRVAVYRPGRSPETLTAPRSLSGDPELSGLVIDLSEVW
ncbi:MAG: Uma2 family endonuclease [Polyangiaceae bacterium]